MERISVLETAGRAILKHRPVDGRERQVGDATAARKKEKRHGGRVEEAQRPSN